MTKETIIERAKQIQGWMRDGELSGLYDLCEEYIKPGDFALEVGSWKGKSSFVIAQVCKEKGAELVCVDTFTGSELNEAHYQEAFDMGSDAFMKKYIKYYLHDLPVTYIVQNSLEAHKELLNESFIFAFIDGNHCDPVISQDLENYYPKVKSGGLFACHDYAQVCPDVKKAVDIKFKDVRDFKVYETIIAFKKL